MEIAEAVIGALQGELSSTAVNAPMVPSEVLSALSPYVSLAENLGRLAVQLVSSSGGGVGDVKVLYRAGGSANEDLDTRVLRAMVTKGLVEPVSSARVNLVNSDFIARQRGLKIREERAPSEGEGEGLLESIEIQLFSVASKFASALGSEGEIKLSGRVKGGVPHLSLVGTFSTDIVLDGSIILCRQVDQPGMIGRVGSLLGSHNVNISFMSVARSGPREHAVMAIGVDEKPPKEVLGEIEALSAVEELVFLEL